MSVRDQMPGGLAARLSCFLVILLIMQSIPGVAEAASIGVTIERVDAANFPTVTIYGSVANDQGLPITGLDQSAFNVLEGNKAVEQFTVRSNANAEPVAATLLVDTSSSVGGDGALTASKQAADAFIDKMNANDTAALISFNDQAQVVQSFTNDKTKLKAAVDGLKSGGSRAQFDAISQAAAQQGSAQAARRAIILVTDGADNASKIQMGDAIKAANDSKTPVFTIGVGTSLNKSVLDTIASSTSAQAIYVSSADQITQIFRNVSEQLHTQYVFSYSSKLPPDNQQHDVSVDAKFNGNETKITATFVAKAPSLKYDVTGITDKSTVSGAQSVEVKPTVGTAKQADLLVDGTVVATAPAAPFKLNWDASKISPGPHTVVVRVTDAAGAPSEQSYSVQVQGGAPASNPTAAATTAAATSAAATTVPTAATAVPTAVATTTVGSANQWIPYAAGGVGVLALAGVGAFLLTRRKPSVTVPSITIAPKPEPAQMSDRTEVIARAPVVPPPPPPVVKPPPVPQQQPVGPSALEATAVVESGQTIVAGQDSGSTIVRQPSLPRARLHVSQSSGESDTNLNQLETILGRDPTNPVVVRDPLASRRHARIIVEDGEFWLEDMKSLNGTRVNGEVITGRRKLLPNDQIKIGEVTMTFLPMN